MIGKREKAWRLNGFMRKSEEGFLRLLEGCSYVIQGGGHTLMTEALHLGKPILTLPLKAMVEQRFNALYIERLGYGMQADMLRLSPELLRQFEADLPRFRENIARGRFCGNELVFGLVDAFIRTGRLPLSGAPVVSEEGGAGGREHDWADCQTKVDTKKTPSSLIFSTVVL